MGFRAALMRPLQNVRKVFSRSTKATKSGSKSGRVIGDVKQGGKKLMTRAGLGYGAATGAGILGGTALAGGTIYNWQNEKTEREAEKTDRYRQYQNRLEEIEQMYRNGDITKSQYDKLREEARQSYLASTEQGRPPTVSEFLANLGMMEALALAALAAALGYAVVRPLVNKIDFEEVL